MAFSSLVTLPLRATADALSLYSAVLDRTADALRAVAGGEPHAEPASAAPPAAATPRDIAAAAAAVTPPVAKPRPVARKPEPETTLGRDAAERREPTPQPATGSSAAQAAGGRRISSPKAARKVRARKVKAAAAATTQTGPASGRGGTPAATKAENTPKARARSRAGREPAPMGSRAPGDS